MIFPLLSIIFLPAFVGTCLAAIGSECYSSHGNGICRLDSTCTDGFTVVGACPKDPSNILCCIKKTCAIDNLTGDCHNKSRVKCNNGFYTPGYCPGDNDVQCCIENKLVEYIRNVYDRATTYASRAKGTVSPPNQLVMEWMRHRDYGDYTWKTLIGPMDESWLQFATNDKLTMFEKFPDPFFKIQVETNHAFATMNGVYLKANEQRADIAGWGGDLVTFYAEWRLSNKKPDEFCNDNLAKENIETSFKLLDLVEDADGYNLGMALRANTNAKIHDVIANYYKPGGEYRKRFSMFFKARFGNATGAASEACRLLLSEDMVIQAGIMYLIERNYKTKPLVTPPFMLSNDELLGFCKAFAHVMEEWANKN